MPRDPAVAHTPATTRADDNPAATGDAHGRGDTGESRRTSLTGAAGVGDDSGTLPRRHSAGGVLWQPGAGGDPAQPRIAVVHRPRHDDWSLPKGRLDPGEHALMAACREVAEETGWQPVAGRRLPTQSYLLTDAVGSGARADATNATGQPARSGHCGVSQPDPATPPHDPAGTAGTAGAAARRTCVPSGTRAAKTVEFWAMRVEARGSQAPDQEVDAVAWLSPQDALSRLSYASDRAVLQAFLAAPAEFATVVLVRHASAGSRQGWASDDRARPLDHVGHVQAARLVEALRCFGPRRIVAADRVRCVQTVTPLAAALGQGVQIDPVFSDEGYDAGPAQALAHLRELVAAASGAGCTVVCSQGGAIPALVGALSRLDSVSPAIPMWAQSASKSAPGSASARSSESPVPPAELPASKASAWTLSFHRGRLVAADYYPDFEAPKPR